MKRINIFEYFDLAESLVSAKVKLAADTLNGGTLYFGLMPLPHKLSAFVDENNGFSACKYSAIELKRAIENWVKENIWDDITEIVNAKFEKEFSGWQYRHISTKIETFRSVFEAECHEVDVYSVGQIAIYKTRDLVANASHAIPEEFRKGMPSESLKEFDDAGRCLAFDLPTACGFHALRGTELVMDDYLKSFGVTKKLISWNDYIKAAEEVANSTGAGPKPSKKVTAMLDRMRSLDRNPLMHPRDELDTASAGHLFSLATITVAEMVKDMRGAKSNSAVALIASKSGAEAPVDKAAEQLGRQRPG